MSKDLRGAEDLRVSSENDWPQSRGSFSGLWLESVQIIGFFLTRHYIKNYRKTTQGRLE